MIEAVASSFAILEELARSNGPRGVTELAKSTGIPKARVHRHLTTLCALNYVEQLEEASKYRASTRLFLLGQMSADNLPWLIATRTMLGLLRDKLGHSVVLSIVEDQNLRVLENYRGDAIVDISSKSGATLPPHASAQGKVLLAFSEHDLVGNLLEEPLHRFTEKTIVDGDTLRAEIDQVKHQGWAASDEELEVDFRSVAAPIFGPGDTLMFTIGIIARAENMSISAKANDVRAALSASADLTKLLRSTINKRH